MQGSPGRRWAKGTNQIFFCFLMAFNTIFIDATIQALISSISHLIKITCLHNEDSGFPFPLRCAVSTTWKAPPPSKSPTVSDTGKRVTTRADTTIGLWSKSIIWIAAPIRRNEGSRFCPLTHHNDFVTKKPRAKCNKWTGNSMLRLTPHWFSLSHEMPSHCYLCLPYFITPFSNCS